MLQARYSPLVSQAEITGKGQPDLFSFQQRKANAGDNFYRQKSYALKDDGDLFIMPGELLVGSRTQHSQSRLTEPVFSSVAGLFHDEHQVPESMMRDYYFAGVAKTEFQYGGETLFGTDPMDHGLGFLRAGSISINNNGADDIHVGDMLAWRFPAFRSGDPKTQGSNNAVSIDTGLNPRASRNRSGTPYGKPLIQVERFDPSDFSMQLAGAYSLLDKPYTQGGISDVPVDRLFDGRKALSSLQEEALGWVHGIITTTARAKDGIGESGSSFYNSCVNADGVLTPVGRRAVNAVFLRNVAPGQNTDAINAFNGFDEANLSRNRYKFVSDSLFNILAGSISGAWYAKTSRIIGKAMSNAKVTQTLDVMVSHFKVGVN